MIPIYIDFVQPFFADREKQFSEQERRILPLNAISKAKFQA
jgi:hypothetical protein